MRRCTYRPPIDRELAEPLCQNPAAWNMWFTTGLGMYVSVCTPHAQWALSNDKEVRQISMITGLEGKP